MAIMVGAPLPILPAQILWIHMTTAVLLGLMLAFEPKEDGIMTRPPRDPDQPLLTLALVERGRTHGADLAEARTAALNVFVVVEAFYLVHCRSLTRSVWRIGLFSHRWILVGVTLQALGQLALTYLPAMNTTFGTAPIGVDVWLRVLAIAILAGVVVAGHERWQARPWQRAGSPSQDDPTRVAVTPADRRTSYP